MNGGIYSVAFSLASAASVFIQLCKCASTTFNILVAINGNIFCINNLVEAHSFVLNEQQSRVRATYITLYSAVDKDLWVACIILNYCYAYCSEMTFLFMHCIAWPKLCRACVGSYLHSLFSGIILVLPGCIAELPNI